MATPYGIQLATHIISSFYGDLCSKVCECLLNRGTLTLTQITRFTELSKENVVNCLRVLIHQNCVQAFVALQEGNSQGNTCYMVLFDNIINKSRATKFKQIVLEELGENCVIIFYALIQHGRLSFDQIRDKEMQKTGSFDVQALRDNFRRLLSARFIERCPAPAPSLGHPSEEEAPLNNKRKSAKIANQKTIEQRALESAAPVESMRFLMEIDDISSEKGEESATIPTSGRKRKIDVLISDKDMLDRKIEVLWRVNYEELFWRLLHKACILYVKTRINDEASIVLRAILDLSGRSKTLLKAEQSPYLSINHIYDEVIKKDGGVGMDIERVEISLDQLGCQNVSTDTDETYSLDIKSIIQLAQNEEVESLVFKRYGKEAYRIFRLLSKASRLVETDKISDSTFIEKKEAAKILFQLYKDEYLHMESISPNGNIRPPTYYLWKVDRQRFREVFLDEMYHSVLNLRLRIAHEQDQSKEVLQLPKDKLVGELKEKFRKCRIVRATLERSLMDLDDAIMLFHHF